MFDLSNQLFVDLFTYLTLIHPGKPVFDSLQLQWNDCFLLSTASTPSLEPTQPPTRWVSRVLSQGIKQPEREADHSRPSNAEVKVRGAIPPLHKANSILA
jgi:hypothetical protein